MSAQACPLASGVLRNHLKPPPMPERSLLVTKAGNTRAPPADDSYVALVSSEWFDGIDLISPVREPSKSSPIAKTRRNQYVLMPRQKAKAIAKQPATASIPAPTLDQPMMETIPSKSMPRRRVLPKVASPLESAPLPPVTVARLDCKFGQVAMPPPTKKQLARVAPSQWPPKHPTEGLAKVAPSQWPPQHVHHQELSQQLQKEPSPTEALQELHPSEPSQQVHRQVVLLPRRRSRTPPWRKPPPTAAEPSDDEGLRPAQFDAHQGRGDWTNQGHRESNDDEWWGAWTGDTAESEYYDYY